MWLMKSCEPSYSRRSRRRNQDKDSCLLQTTRTMKPKKFLSKLWMELKIPYLPSETNFVFIDLKGPLAPFAKRMKEEHILVGRPFPPADTWCRISLGTPDEMRYFVKKLKEFREKGWV